jgi:tRNA 2-selenouridine synthase
MTATMSYTLPPLGVFARHDFDAVIDVRSPAEFAEDHLPGALNLPVLSNEERATVGTLYVQESRFRARKVGAALVARNAADHLETALSDRDGSFRPLVYCWRGGQRSGSFATILKAVGWRVEVLDGGYQRWRRAVNTLLYDTPLQARPVLLDGNTGTAKTELLRHLSDLGLQVVDLEGLAQHRGSLFGSVGQQPSQKMFEGRLAHALADLDPSKPVILEAESSKIGDRIIPPSLWHAMRSADRIRLNAPLPVRAAYLARRYEDIVADPARLDTVLDQLIPHQGHALVAHWHSMAREGAFEALASSLMEHHYDPRYTRQRGRAGGSNAVALTLDDLSSSALPAAAERIAAAVSALSERQPASAG